MQLSLMWAVHSQQPSPNFFERDWEERARIEAESASKAIEDKFDDFFGPRAVEDDPS